MDANHAGMLPMTISVFSYRLLEHCRSGYLCDTYLIIGDKALKAHSIILATSSELFKQKLDKQLDLEWKYILLPEVDYATVCAAVYFIYTGILMLPWGKDQEYCYYLKLALINLGLDSVRLSECQIFLERNNELQFNFTPTSEVFGEKFLLDCNNVQDKEWSLDDIILFERQKKLQLVTNNVTDLNQVIKTDAQENGNHVGTDLANDSGTEAADDLTDEDVIKIEPIPKRSPRRAGRKAGRKSNKQKKSKSKVATEADVKKEIDDNSTGEKRNQNVSQKLGSGEINLSEAHLIIEGSATPVYACKHCSVLFVTESDYWKHQKTHENNVKDTPTGRTRRPRKCKLSPPSPEKPPSPPPPPSPVEDEEEDDITQEDSADSDSTEEMIRKSPKMRQKLKLKPVKTRKFECDMCGRKFALEQSLRNHYRTIHDKKDESCRTSDDSDSSKKGVRCRRCRKYFHNKSELDEHECELSTEETGGAVLCHVCGKEFKHRDSLRRHMAKPHKEHKCEKCGTNYNTRILLYQHCLITHGIHLNYRNTPKEEKVVSKKDDPKVNLCDICGKGFVSRKSYFSHIRRKHRKVCSICQESFVEDGQLEEHVKRMHPGQECVPYNWCNICEKSIAGDVRSLREHMQLHNDTRPYVCQTCGFAFPTIARLRVHVAKYHTEESAELPEKLKNVANQPRPRLNMNLIRTTKKVIRLGGKKFQCKECGTMLESYMKMRAHMARHTGDFPYHCTQCDKKYLYQSNLISHMRVHTDDKPFTCEECGQKFRQNSHLARHMHQHRTTSAAKPSFLCEICDKSFISNLELSEHYRQIHSVELEIAAVVPLPPTTTTTLYTTLNLPTAVGAVMPPGVTAEQLGFTAYLR